MSYTKQGPFADRSLPAMTGARLNAIDQGIADAHPATGPTTRTVALGTVYQPNVNRPTCVVTSVGANGNSQVDIYLGPDAGHMTRVAICGSTSEWTPCVFMVPAGYYYELVASAGAPNVLGNAVAEIAM